MAVCEWCQREMLTATACTWTSEEIGGVVFQRIKYGQEQGVDASRPCHDCNVVTGEYHHPGCDMEQCPRCKGQIISCGCLDEDEAEDD